MTGQAASEVLLPLLCNVKFLELRPLYQPGHIDGISLEGIDLSYVKRHESSRSSLRFLFVQTHRLHKRSHKLNFD